MGALSKDPLFQRDLYVGIESLRNSWDLLMKHLGSWISDRLRFHDGKDEAWVAEHQVLWEALGVEEEARVLLAETLQYEFKAGNIWISTAAADLHDVISIIESTLKAAWKFRSWTTSRWCTLGSSARTLITGMLTGLQSLCQLITRDNESGLFYLQGFSRLTGDRLQYLVEAALVSK
eukprot:4684261-Lingulodinium_polyedra.AAC.1